MKEYEISELADILNGYSFKSKEYVDEGIRVIRITNVQNGKIVDESPVYYEDKTILDKYKLKENDIVISLTGNVGRVGYVDQKILPAYLNQRVGCIRCNNNIVNSKYLYYLFNSNKFENDCIISSNGIAQLNLSTEWLKQYKINIPSLEIQKKRLSILEKLDKNIYFKEKQIKKLDELIKSQFIEMFGILNNEDKYDKVEFNTVVKDILRGPFGSDLKKSLYVPESNDTYKVYIQINAIDKNENLGDYYISKEYFNQKMYKFELNPNDYIITCDGTIGKYIKLSNNMKKGIISSSLLKITLDDSKMNEKFFEVLWENYMLPKLTSKIRNAALQHLPSAKNVGLVQCPLPPIELQNRFADIVKQIDKQKFIIEKLIKILGT